MQCAQGALFRSLLQIDTASRVNLASVRIAMNRFKLTRLVVVLLCLCLAVALCAQQRENSSRRWSFDRTQGASPLDSTRGEKASLSGSYAYVPGVAGDALRFDGYTTAMTIPASDRWALGRGGFTVEAWVALNTYPWNWVPIVDHEAQRQQGFTFGIDAFGHFGLKASINGRWKSVESTTILPLKKWVHIAGTYQTSDGHGLLTIFLNGAKAGQLPIQGQLSPASADILIGRVREATMPFPEGAIRPKYPVWYSLDGLLDELVIDTHALGAAEIARDYAAVNAPAGEVLAWQKMPSGPPGPGTFGAFYTTLHYQPSWDNLRRLGPDSDVLVRFDESPIRLVFWQGTNYVPAWVTGNGKWYTDEFAETWGSGCPAGGDCEPMSDKQSRYSHVNIMESSDARVVVHWRYALAEVEHSLGAWRNPEAGWFDWADEYWTIYPDGVAVRKQVLHSSALNRDHEWQETIVLHQPGSRPEDDINWDAITLENMFGQQKTYSWNPKAAGDFTTPNGPSELSGPPDPNIQVVNLKSTWKPFQIIPPDGASADFYNNEPTYFGFECWNHWPVAQIASSDRPCVAADRASHSSLSHLFWKPYAESSYSETKILMDGLTTMSPAGLLPLAKSWLSPPALQLRSQGYRSEGYDPTQRAYVLTRLVVANRGSLKLRLNASAASPIFDPAVVVKSWGGAAARLRVDGKDEAWGKNFRVGYINLLQGKELVLWIQEQSTQPLSIELIPVAR